MAKKKDFLYNWDDVPVVVDVPYAAWVLGVTPETVRKECQRGKLKAFKVADTCWRIRKDDLIAYTMGKGDKSA